ncbi:hypothetical protein AKJ16_DCAP00105 [Drosera capensis]
MAFRLIPPNPISKLGTPGRHLYSYIGSGGDPQPSSRRIFIFSRSTNASPLSSVSRLDIFGDLLGWGSGRL